jgi:diaminopimelate epimerase
MRFTKMHGLGNDYVYVDGSRESIDDPAALARLVADRHFGIGGDGLILILPSSRADVRMRMFNADGSESEMCGNGVRCVAKYAFDHKLTAANPMRVETGRGVLSLQLHLKAGKVDRVTVAMGQPILAVPEIPADASHLSPAGGHLFALRPSIAGAEAPMTLVSMGNPHAVQFVDDVNAIDLERIGPAVEHHPAFPRRVNYHIAQIHSRDELTMRTWERGSGITLACGTGACATAVAAILVGKANRKLLAHLPGGDLELEWREADNQVLMTGPAVEVFEGVW